MNVYILLDTSGSIQKKDFEISRDAIISLLKKVCKNRRLRHIYLYLLSVGEPFIFPSSWIAMK